MDKEGTSIIEKLKAMKSNYYYKIYEGKVVKSLLEKNFVGKTQSAGYLSRELDRLDFKIATEALNLKQERELMKKARSLRAELKKADEKERLERKLRFIDNDTKKLKEEIDALESELDRIGEERRKEKKLAKVKESIKADMPEVKSDDGKVSLGDVCIIKKKG